MGSGRGVEWGGRRRWVALVIAIATLPAACGGSGDDLVQEALVTEPTTDTAPSGEDLADEIIDDVMDLELGNEAEQPQGLEVDIEEITGFEARGLAAADGTLWMTDIDNDVIRSVDLTSGEVSGDIEVGDAPLGIAVDGDEVWVTNSSAGDHSVMKLDGATGQVELTVEMEAGTQPSGVGLTDEHVWVATDGGGDLAQIDRATGTVVATVGDGSGSAGSYGDVLVTDDDIWTVDRWCGRVLRIDPDTATVAATYDDLGYDASEPDTCTGIVTANGPLRLAEFDGGVFVLAEVAPDGGLQVGRIYRIDMDTDEVESVLDLQIQVGIVSPLGLPAFVVEEGGIWLSAGDTAARIDRAGGPPQGVLGGGFSTTVVALVEVDGVVWHALVDTSDSSISGLYGVDADEATAAAAR